MALDLLLCNSLGRPHAKGLLVVVLSHLAGTFGLKERKKKFKIQEYWLFVLAKSNKRFEKILFVFKELNSQKLV